MVDPVFAIAPVARGYAWGSTTAIAALLGVAPTGAPVAELWYGAHADSPSTVVEGGGDPLDRLIAADPVALLGAEVAREFGGQLPFLLKVLAAEHALSIQVHPTLAQAQAGYARESERNVALDSAQRNYRDRNHKPELLCALSDFDALCGFREPHDTVRLLAALDVAELSAVASALTGAEPLRAAFEMLLDWPEASRAGLVAAVLKACDRLADRGGEWTLATHAALAAGADFPGDIGVALSLLLNAVRLRAGEAIYLGAGNVHAYLHGIGVEIMANSDNVLRCGLTPKHVDVAEVLRVTDFTALALPRCAPRAVGAGVQTYPVPVADFELSVLTVPAATVSAARGPQILLCTAGAVGLASGAIELRPGQAVFAAADTRVSMTGVGTVFRAAVSS